MTTERSAASAACPKFLGDASLGFSWAGRGPRPSSRGKPDDEPPRPLASLRSRLPLALVPQATTYELPACGTSLPLPRHVERR
jgi:hypothetical protein